MVHWGKYIAVALALAATCLVAPISLAGAQERPAPEADALSEQATGLYVAGVVTRLAGAGWAAGEGIGFMVCALSDHTVCDENLVRAIASTLVSTIGIGLLSSAIGLDVQSNRRRQSVGVRSLELRMTPLRGGAWVALSGTFGG